MTSNSSRFRKVLARIDWTLVALVTMLGIIGVINLMSAARADYGFALHVSQTIWLLLGAGVVVVILIFDHRVYERWAYIFYGGVLVLLGLVLVAGTELNGSKRWLALGFFNMQPSELMKIAIILLTARYFADRDRAESYGLVQLAPLFGAVAAGAGLILAEPDLGTTLVILAIFMTMVLFEGMKWSSLVTLAAIGVFSLPFVWTLGMHDYQRDRVMAFLHLTDDEYGSSWQVRQSVIAFGSGRVWGKGHVEGTQIQKGFVPEHENDFVAANWGEEHGFVGMLLLLGLYFVLIVWALRISSIARDRFGAHIGVGVAAMLFWHVFVNVGMVTGMLPVVGLTLPFLSAGGSSLVTMMMGIGLLLNVSVRRKPL